MKNVYFVQVGFAFDKRCQQQTRHAHGLQCVELTDDAFQVTALISPPFLGGLGRDKAVNEDVVEHGLIIIRDIRVRGIVYTLHDCVRYFS